MMRRRAILDTDRRWVKTLQNITDISSPSTIIRDTSWIRSMKVDGQVIPLSSTYQFSSTGVHRVDILPTSSILHTGKFLNNTALISVQLSEMIKTLEGQIFDGCTNLVSIDGLERINAIGPRCFRNCSSLAGVLYLPALSSVSEGAFAGSGISGVESLGSITALTRTSSDELGPFSYCPNLEYCNLPGTLQTIYQLTFQYSPNMTSLTLPAGLTAIRGYWSFLGRSQITHLTSLAETPPVVYSTQFASAAGLQSIKVPAGSVDAYKAAAKWSNYSSIITAI